MFHYCSNMGLNPGFSPRLIIQAIRMLEPGDVVITVDDGVTWQKKIRWRNGATSQLWETNALG